MLVGVLVEQSLFVGVHINVPVPLDQTIREARLPGVVLLGQQVVALEPPALAHAQHVRCLQQIAVRKARHLCLQKTHQTADLLVSLCNGGRAGQCIGVLLQAGEMRAVEGHAAGLIGQAEALVIAQVLLGEQALGYTLAEDGLQLEAATCHHGRLEEIAGL